MEINSQGSREKLKSQILNSYGKLSYTLTSHEKEIQYLINTEKNLKILQIILSAVSTGSIVSVLFGQGLVATKIASVLSLSLLILNSFTIKFDFLSDINRHKKSSNKLWILREEYLSLLTDFDDLNLRDIREKRDIILQRTHEIYSESPRTSRSSYRKTQKALKVEEEQFFTNEEINQLLPPSLRNKK